MPPGAMPKAPAGFKVDLVATGLQQAAHHPRGAQRRRLRGRERRRPDPGLPRPRPAAAWPRPRRSLPQSLQKPYGIAFHPPGPNPTHVYVGEHHQVVRFPYKNGDLKASGPAQVIVPGIPTERHWTRDVVFVEGRRAALRRHRVGVEHRGRHAGA